MTSWIHTEERKKMHQFSFLIFIFKFEEASCTQEDIWPYSITFYKKNWILSAFQFVLIHHKNYLRLILTWGENIFTTRGFFPSRWNSKKNVETSWLISCSVMLVQGNSITLPCQKRLLYISIQPLCRPGIHCICQPYHEPTITIWG